MWKAADRLESNTSNKNNNVFKLYRREHVSYTTQLISVCFKLYLREHISYTTQLITVCFKLYRREHISYTTQLITVCFILDATGLLVIIENMYVGTMGKEME